MLLEGMKIAGKLSRHYYNSSVFCFVCSNQQKQQKVLSVSEAWVKGKGEGRGECRVREKAFPVE